MMIIDITTSRIKLSYSVLDVSLLGSDYVIFGNQRKKNIAWDTKISFSEFYTKKENLTLSLLRKNERTIRSQPMINGGIGNL